MLPFVCAFALQIEDVLFYLRNDRKKYARVKDMLIQHERIRQARRPFEAPKEEKLAADLGKEQERQVASEDMK